MEKALKIVGISMSRIAYMHHPFLIFPLQSCSFSSSSLRRLLQPSTFEPAADEQPIAQHSSIKSPYPAKPATQTSRPPADRSKPHARSRFGRGNA